MAQIAVMAVLLGVASISVSGRSNCASFDFELYSDITALTAPIEKDTFHIGDVINDITSLGSKISRFCNSTGGEILGVILKAIPEYGLEASEGYEVFCEGVTDLVKGLHALCNIFDIDTCTKTEKKDIIVSACWSSDVISYSGSSTQASFKKYLNDKYDINATYAEETMVSGETYNSTQVTLEDCGSSDNYFIAGVFDRSDNTQQNNIGSGVIQYLVNQGIANTNNKVEGVKRYDVADQDLLDVIRSNQGLLLHYNKPDDLPWISSDYGIYYCEFNVVEINQAYVSFAANLNIILVFILCTLLL